MTAPPIEPGDEAPEEDYPDQILYAPDFTPETLGKTLGPDRVLPWLLQTAKSSPKEAFIAAVKSTCMAHVQGDDEKKRAANQRDMTNKVFIAMKNYKLIIMDEQRRLHLTAVGEELLAAPTDRRDLLFARHILTECKGYLLVQEIERMEKAGREVNMEALARKLEPGINAAKRSTGKSLSSLRAWLARGGVLTRSGTYKVDREGLKRVLGQGVEKLMGLDLMTAQFVLAARCMELSLGKTVLAAPDVATLAEQRAEDLVIPRKSLGSLVERLQKEGVLKSSTLSGPGGWRRSVELQERFRGLSDEQLLKLLAQMDSAVDLRRLKSLIDLRPLLASPDKYLAGEAGEMLAIHLCLHLGLKVLHWRKRAPHSEIDVIAEREAALTYQRWAIQVKNLGTGTLDNDRVDREVGAAAGTGITHILFVNPRGGLTEVARREIEARSRLTPLQIYYVTAKSLQAADSMKAALEEIFEQQRRITSMKREEARRREMYEPLDEG